MSKLLALTKYPDTPAALKSRIFKAISHLSQAVAPSGSPATPAPQPSLLANIKPGYKQPVSDNTVQDYCMMLYADDNKDVALFAIQNLANVIEGGIR